MRVLKLISVLLAIFSAPLTQANDSVARVGVGGLELLKTDDIEMTSEVLEISAAKIRVTYHFRNTSEHDITTTVAFPMPAFGDGAQMSESYANAKPLDTFKTYVNGRQLSGNKQQEFLVKGVDVSNKLRKVGLTDKQIYDPTFSCTTQLTPFFETNESEMGSYAFNAEPKCNLSAEQVRKIFVLLGKNTTSPTIKETAYWEQTFPANKEIEVVHEYKPFVGDYPYRGVGEEKIRKEVCIDQATEKLIKRRIESGGTLTYHDVEYILGTGRNWKGPIKKFKLLINKQSPLDVVSLCFPGRAKKTSPTTLEFEQENYVPQDKLILNFYPFVEYK